MRALTQQNSMTRLANGVNEEIRYLPAFLVKNA